MPNARKEVQPADKWNVEALFPSFEDWKREFAAEFPADRLPRWPELASYRNTLGTRPSALKEALSLQFDIHRRIEKLYTYAHLRHDEDITHSDHKTAYQSILGILHEFIQESSWLEPELLALPDETLRHYLAAPELNEYRFHLEKILRIKHHTLSAENEYLLALAGNSLQTAKKAFSAINDADFKFPPAKTETGEVKEISHATYGLYIRNQDRILRQSAFTAYHGKYRDYENTLCELLQGQVHNHLFNAKARRYSSCLEAALYPNNIDPSVYHALIAAVNENLDALHDYMDLRMELLGIEELHHYDLYVPLTKDLDITMSYEEAEEAVIQAVEPLGTEYSAILQTGLQRDRWVDRFENNNKRSGAYSSGCYDSMPYILMNYKNVIRDVFTLAHEAGHSMHSYLSHAHQPYPYASYSIFLAEVASTFNEDLLTRYLLARSTNPAEKIFLINQKIEDIRTTLFRQTMFAEFELLIHHFAEKNIPLTPALLTEEYLKLNCKYFGKRVIPDPEIGIEWARIPHFYYNFYVYQYATGISAALALSDKVTHGDSGDRERYLSFLKGGCSRYPIDLLKIAGVDMTTAEPVNQAIGKFRKLVAELKNLALQPKIC